MHHLEVSKAGDTCNITNSDLEIEDDNLINTAACHIQKNDCLSLFILVGLCFVYRLAYLWIFEFTERPKSLTPSVSQFQATNMCLTKIYFVSVLHAGK